MRQIGTATDVLESGGDETEDFERVLAPARWRWTMSISASRAGFFSASRRVSLLPPLSP
jgi:hypothetical protein